MFPARTVLAPVDFSDASRGSLHYAARLARRWNATLHVMHALDPLLAAAAQTRRLDLVAGTRDELESFCASAGVHDDVGATFHVAVGPAAATICDTAIELRSDLIVAGSSGLSGLNRLVMGTTVEHVIRGARVPVLAVAGRSPGDDVSHWGPVIAAVDDPAAPQAVTRGAAAFASSLGAALHVVHVVPPLTAPARWRGDADAVWQTRCNAARRELTAALRDSDVEPQNVHVVGGSVPDALAGEASRHTHTMPILVLGRARPGDGHAPGSVASRVIARATAPVLVYLEASSL
jgi:nucleotide-binding universal stress UspA family protein